MTKFCEACKTGREQTLSTEHPDTIRSNFLLDCISRALHNPEYLQTLKSRDDGLLTDAEEMMKAELQVKAQELEKAKAVLEQDATKRGQALLEAQKAQLAAEEKARLEEEDKARLEAEKKARLEAEEKARLGACAFRCTVA